MQMAFEFFDSVKDLLTVSAAVVQLPAIREVFFLTFIHFKTYLNVCKLHTDEVFL